MTVEFTINQICPFPFNHIPPKIPIAHYTAPISLSGWCPGTTHFILLSNVITVVCYKYFF